MPPTCRECGKALRSRRRFCSDVCTLDYHSATYPSRASTVAAVIARRNNPTTAMADQAGRNAKISANARAAREWKRRPGWSKTADAAAREHFAAHVAPILATIPIAAIMTATGLSKPAAIRIRRNRSTPHPRHFASLAALAGLALPTAPDGAGR